METKELRRGWTTGACATAAAVAAFEGLTVGRSPDWVTITLPRGETPDFAIDRAAASQPPGEWAAAEVIKDAGDDPDVTHGARIGVKVAWRDSASGIFFRAGVGVGRVTRPGLALAVGEPAINPVPRAMISQNLMAAAARLGVERSLDLEVEVSVADGERLAEQTLNSRLGIVGGLSILGTTGIVIPYSCSAWIHSIQRGVDVAVASGVTHLIASTGRTSEVAAQNHYQLPDYAMIEMGDFVGGFLKYLRQHPDYLARLDRLTIAGGIGKMVKLAQGNLDLHSRRCRVDFAQLDGWMGAAGRDFAAPIAPTTAAGYFAEVAGHDPQLAAWGRAEVARRAARLVQDFLQSDHGLPKIDVFIPEERSE